MPDHSLARDAGLVRGLGVLGLAASIVNTVIGVGVFTLPALLVAQAGWAAPLCYALCGFCMGGITICFAEAGSRVPTSGGAYGTVEAALGPAAAFVVGMLLIVSDALASGGIASALADLAGAAAPLIASGPARWAFLLALYLAMVAANLAGVRILARVITWATAIKILPLLLFLILAGVAAFSPAVPDAAHPTSWTGFGRGLILTLFAFTGMETALGASGEVSAPSRTVPRALFAAMLFILALYLGAQFGAGHMLGAALPASQAPLADAVRRFGTLPRAVLLSGGAVSMLAYLVSDIMGASRMLFAMGRDRLLPSVLGRIDSRRVPRVSVLLYAALSCLLALTGSFVELLILSSLAVVGIYALGAIAGVVLKRRGVALAGKPLNFPGLTVAAAVALAGLAFMVTAASWREVAGLAAVIAASLTIYAVRRRLAESDKLRRQPDAV